MNPYEVLDVPEDATEEDIKKSYRTLSKKLHPDKGGDAEAFGKLALAYETLVDLDKRQEYDECGSYQEELGDIGAAGLFLIHQAFLGVVEGFLRQETEDSRRRGRHDPFDLDLQTGRIQSLGGIPGTKTKDLLLNIESSVSYQVSQVLEKKEHALERIKQLDKLSARIVYKGDGNDVIHTLIEELKSEPQEEVRDLSNAYKILLKSLDMLNNWEWSEQNQGTAGHQHVPRRLEY